MRHAASAIRYTTTNATDLGPAPFVLGLDVVVDRAGVDSM